ncbi:alpha/beta fold hydrolase [Leptolyngbya sp. NIES-2104]|uniref:alpha/beta fold hydrolase n=1 Tax=Leptolyngbya sp. NIES-2104 TaxID=1552121 RepID=UPI0006EC923C|nr:alpha/beta fold hydrolase [Leptolyngbya sp. NIES-2104]GAP99356.1 possible alpha/beta hydrolase superfamily [Leptolyngbya sp. NIES-2104]
MITAPTVSTEYKIWMWKGFQVAYQAQGTEGIPVVLVHGFGASFFHWRKNIPELAKNCRVYAIDLIGFGKSAKPKPVEQIEYTFETWGDQIADFCREVIGEPAVLIGNSIGCIAVMQAAVDHPEIARSLALLNCSLRLLHDRHRATQPWIKRIGAPILQKVLQNQAFGQWFFSQIAKPKAVRNILLKAYVNSEAVTDELVELLLGAASDQGATAVFIAFTGYSSGPLPEDLLPKLPCCAIVLWGEKDPWEPIALGRKFADYPQVKEFIPLPNVGHCPQDEAPELVNPILQRWIEQTATESKNS